jgi:hypothetical protein
MSVDLTAPNRNGFTREKRRHFVRVEVLFLRPRAFIGALDSRRGVVLKHAETRLFAARRVLERLRDELTPKIDGGEDSDS